MTTEDPSLRLQEIRRRHLDFPCGAYSVDDECFLLSQVAVHEDTANRLADELATITREQKELVETRRENVSLTEEFAFLKGIKGDLDKEISALRAENSRITQVLGMLSRIATENLPEPKE